MTISLHIERLVLEGWDSERMRESDLQAAVSQELSRLLGEGGLAADLNSGGEWPALPKALINMPSGMDSAMLGKHVALGLFGCIGPPPNSFSELAASD